LAGKSSPIFAPSDTPNGDALTAQAIERVARKLVCERLADAVDPVVGLAVRKRKALPPGIWIIGSARLMRGGTLGSYLSSSLCPDIALLQECVAPRDLDRSKIVHRQIAGSRSWGSAVAVFNNECDIEEVGAVRTKYSTLFPMLGTYPGATIVARVHVPGIGAVTCVSVYGPINVYAQTTMLRIIADLIALGSNAPPGGGECTP
jgi:hypothetical protein